MRINFEYVSALQYEVRALRAQVQAFKSGEAYRSMKEDYERQLREKDRIIVAQKQEIAAAHSLSEMTKRAFRAEVSRDQWHDKCKEQQAALYAALTEVEELKELNRKLTAQVNMDFENSSLPSSLQGPKRKKIPNSREKTDQFSL